MLAYLYKLTNNNNKKVLNTTITYGIIFQTLKKLKGESHGNASRAREQGEERKEPMNESWRDDIWNEKCMGKERNWIEDVVFIWKKEEVGA